MAQQVQYYPTGTRVEFTKMGCMVPYGTKGTVEELDKKGHLLTHRILWDIYVGESHQINTADSNGRSTWQHCSELRRLEERSYQQGDRVLIKIGLAGYPAGTVATILSVDYNSTNRLKYYIDFRTGQTMWVGDLEIEPEKSYKPMLYNPITFEAMAPEVGIETRVSFVRAGDSDVNLFTERVRSTVKESEIEELSRVENFSF